MVVRDVPAYNHYPHPMTYPDLAKMLHEIADLIGSGDSWEGFVEYVIPTDHAHGATDGNGLDGAMVDVRARFRIGNTMGQGSIRFVGDLRP